MKTLLQTLFVSCLLALQVLSAHAVEPRMSMRQDGNMLTVEGQLDVPVNRTTAWAVLTDYARFHEFVPGITSSRIVEQRDNLKMLEQRGVVNAGQFRMPFQGAVRVDERLREGRPDGLTIVFVSGPLKDIQGEWNIKSGTPLLLSYRMHMDLMKTPFPPPIAVTIIEQQVRTWVEAFAREMQAVKRNQE